MFKTLILSTWLIFHPVHVSLTSIDYAPGADSFKVFVRMFYDDFLLDFRLNSRDKQNNDFSGNDSNSRDLMGTYLNEKMMIFVNEKQLTGKIQDMELVDGELNMNLLFMSTKKPRSITVKSLIMTDLYKDQSNMIIIRINDFEEGIKLTSEKTEQTFKIK